MVRVLGLVLLAAAGTGCATGEDSASARNEREQLCTRLLRDMRLYCSDGGGVRGDRAETSMDCLSRRLQFETACF